MKPGQLEDLLRYRMEQAFETLRESEILLGEAAFRGTINRAYYAMFYTVLALLATKQLGASKHSTVTSLFVGSLSKLVYFLVNFRVHCTWHLIVVKPMITVS